MKFTGRQTLSLFITGAAAGAILALLYAPKSGAQTRRDVRRLTRKTANRLGELQEDVRDQVGGWLEDVNERVRDGIKTGKEIGTQTCEQVIDAFDAAKKAVQDGKSRIEKILA